MEGAKVAGSAVDGALAALNAGCDMVLLCNQSIDGGQAVDALLDGLQAAQASGRWHPDGDSEARRLDLLPLSPPLPWDELMHQPAYQHALEKLP
jgi:beta-N-acetylhexosaminidase